LALGPAGKCAHFHCKSWLDEVPECLSPASGLRNSLVVPAAYVLIKNAAHSGNLTCCNGAALIELAMITAIGVSITTQIDIKRVLSHSTSA